MSAELRAADAMTRDVVTVFPDESVREAAKLMDKYRIGCVVVVSRENPRKVVGILTEADIVRRVVARGLDPHETRVRDVMTPNPITVREDAPLDEVADLMGRKDIGHIPVVNDADDLVGIITRTDIIRLAPGLIEMLYVLSREREQ